MAGEFGGIYEKLGNRYEALWVVREMVRVLAEELRCVTLEKLGDDSEGVDLWVVDKGGIREAQQCKRQNAGDGKWTLAHLHARGVLKAIAIHLPRDPTCRFAFVSSDPAPQLRSLCDSSSLASGGGELFETFLSTDSHRQAMQAFCRYLGLGPTDDQGMGTAYDLLRRTRVQIVDAGLGGRQEVHSSIRRYIDGDEGAVAELLAGLAFDNLNKPLYADAIRERLLEAGFQVRRLALDKRIVPRIQALQVEFVEQLSACLIAGKLIPRAETKDLADWIAQDQGPRLLVLNGAKGRGKSTVLLELIDYLRREAIPYLPLRLDRRPPQKSARIFGEDCGLPESPVLCLSESAGDRKAVLILDQLDALRWSGAHAAAHVEVIREIVGETLDSRNLRLVITCRTFDLKEDLQFHAIFNCDKLKHEVKELEVKELSNEAVSPVVASQGADWSKLSDRQKQLLRNADLLAIWTGIQHRLKTPFAFASASDLMRQFFRDRREDAKKACLSLNEFDVALELLVAEMARREWQFAPTRVLDRLPSAQKVLQSLGVISVTEDRITFCHQGYLEYLLAEHGLHQIRTGSTTILEWLGREQSLLRRESLRQVLLLLRDDDPDSYMAAVREIVQAVAVRFHIQHLAVQTLIYQSDPRPAEVDLLLELLADAAWHQSMLRLLIGKPVWFNHLKQRGVLGEWLASGDPERINDLRWLAINVAEHCGDEIADLVEPFLQAVCSEQLATYVADMLPLNPGDDTRRLFDVRLLMIRRGIRRFALDLLDLRKLVERHPGWCLELVEAFLDMLATSAATDDRRGRQRVHADEALITAARHEPLEAWCRLMPRVEQLAKQTPSDFNSGESFIADDFWTHRYGDEKELGFILDDLVAVGPILAETIPGAFWEQVYRWSESQFQVVQRVLLRTMEMVPTNHATRVLEWLITDPRRLRLGEQLALSSWGIARRLLERFAPHCEDTCFDRLERFILACTDDREIKSIRAVHEKRMNGDFAALNNWGRARHALLAGMPDCRLSRTAQSMKGQLDRKFGPYNRTEELRRTPSVVTVESPLRQKAREYLSDKQWLEIIRAKRGRLGSARRRHVDGPWSASSPEHFSKTLRVHTHREPSRFARLALQFLDGANPHYIYAILSALEATEAPSDLDEDRKAAWRPASTNEIETVLKRIGFTENSSIAMFICWLVGKRAEDNWSPEAVLLISRYATEHAHPGPTQFTDGIQDVRSREFEPDLEGSAPNCVRGSASHAIAALLFAHHEMFEIVRPAIEWLVGDQSPAVRIAALRACLPVLDLDRDAAVELFMAGCDMADDRILKSREVWDFFRYAWRSHLAQLTPLIQRMLLSTAPDVACIGAKLVTGIFLFSDQFEGEFNRCREGSPEHRAGVARIVADCIMEEEVATRCAEIVSELFEDEEVMVRREATRVFFADKVLESDQGPKLASAYVRSHAFLDAPSPLLRAFEDYSGSLRGYSDVIVDVCERFVGPLREAALDIQTSIAGDVLHLPKLILRLYDESEQLKDNSLRSQCLEIFDSMLRADLWSSRDLLKGLDQ